MAGASLHQCFNALAEVSDGAGDGWGEVLAVAVIHEHGVRAVTYARPLALAKPEATAEGLSTLGVLMREARNGGLS